MKKIIVNNSAARKGDSSASTQECPNSKLKITCSIWLDNDNRFSTDLADKDQVADPVQKCIDKAVSAFKFVMEIPDPSQAKTESMTQSRSAVRSLTSCVLPLLMLQQELLLIQRDCIAYLTVLIL